MDLFLIYTSTNKKIVLKYTDNTSIWSAILLLCTASALGDLTKGQEDQFGNISISCGDSGLGFGNDLDRVSKQQHLLWLGTQALEVGGCSYAGTAPATQQQLPSREMPGSVQGLGGT